jgi:hypothetical protein
MVDNREVGINSFGNVFIEFDIDLSLLWLLVITHGLVDVFFFVGHHLVVIVLRPYNSVVILTHTGSGWDSVTYDYIFFKSFKKVYFTCNSSLVQYFGRFLERCRRDKRFGLGDALVIPAIPVLR